MHTTTQNSKVEITMSNPTSDYSYQLAPTNQQLGHIAGEYGLPFLGKTIAIFADPIKTFHQHYLKFGPVSRISITGQKAVLLLGPQYLQMLLLDSDRNFSTKKGWDVFMSDFFAGGLLMRDFEEHRIHRRIMQTAFKSDSMRLYADTINAVVREAVARWQKQGNVLFYQEIKKLLLSIAFEVFCKVDDADSDEDNINRAFVDLMEGAMGMVRKDWPGLLYHRGMNGRRYLTNYFKKLVPKKRSGNDQDIFSHFCREKNEAGEYFSDTEIADHMVFLMLAAHDTTTSTVTMAGYYLANDPALQDRILSQLAPAFDYDALMEKTPALDQVFRETLRLHPPVSNLFRRTVRECTIDGIRIPAHTMISAPIHYIQQMSEHWTRAQTFWPERFSDGIAEHKKHPFMWAPFGGGAHKCIGMHFAELLFKCTFAELIQQCHFEFSRENYFPTKLQHFPFAKPLDDLPLLISKR
jgi:cytochrome P450